MSLVCYFDIYMYIYAKECLSPVRFTYTESVMVSTDPETADINDPSAFIALPVSLFEEVNTTDVGIFFTFYDTAALFPLRDNLLDNFTVGTSVIGATVAGEIFENLSDPIIIILQLSNEVGPMSIL